MIKLTSVKKSVARKLMEKCGTSEDKIKVAMSKIGDKVLKYGVDSITAGHNTVRIPIYTIVQVGNMYGVAKRTTYQKNPDMFRQEVGFTIALFRAIGW